MNPLNSIKEIPLLGTWRLNHFKPGEANVSKLTQLDYVPEGWLEAKVPGEVHLDLMKSGKIHGFYYGKDPQEYKWIEDEDWWYWTEFYIPADFKQQRVELIFEGLDCFATIWLNGKQIAQSADMFVPLNCVVTQQVRYGKRNVIMVRLASPIKSVEGKDTSKLFSTTSFDRILARKAQMSYSWDFCGRCVTTGIWKPVYLRSYTTAVIRDIHIVTQLQNQQDAIIHYSIEIENVSQVKQKVGLEVNLSRKNTQFVSRLNPTLNKGINQIHGQINVKKAEYWWPWNMGSPNLYDFQVYLRQKNTILDSSHLRFGIREIKLIQSPQDDGGKSFTFCINNRPFFAKGANWVTPNMTFADISEKDYRDRLTLAKEGNISMLRVWGGGIYEHDSFYNLCDEMGILIFHDFMFACGVYPQDPEFLELVKQEGTHVVRRLRNHPSLIAWSGDNENDAAYQWAKRPFGAWNENLLTRKVLKEVTQILDPTRPYLPSSPYSPDSSKEPGDPMMGDSHNYCMSLDPASPHYYKKYGELQSRFESEFGFGVLPEPDSFYKFNHLRISLKTPEVPDVFVFPMGHKLSLTNPLELDSVLWESQLFHAYGLRYAIEHFRRRKWYCSGTLYWKFNDPYADAHWIFPSQMSVLDLYLKPRIAYYWTRKAYEPVILSFKEESDKGISLWVINDQDKQITDTILLRRFDLNGKLISQEKISVFIPPDISVKVKSIDFRKYMNPQNEFLHMQFTKSTSMIESTYFPVDFTGWRGLPFPKAVLKIHVSTAGKKNTIQVDIKTDVYANVIRLEIPGISARYNDNYFCLLPNSHRTILIEPRDPQIDLHGKRLLVSALNSKNYQIELSPGTSLYP